MRSLMADQAALDPPGWQDRHRRGGWETRYTTVGACPKHIEFDPGCPSLAFQLSSVLIASRSRPKVHSPSLDVSYWVTLARRLIQRGTAPVVHTGQESEREVIDGAVLWSLFPSSTNARLDPDIGVHEALELPFLEALRESRPHEATFLLPQAPLRAAANGKDRSTTEWIDFLFAPPDQALTAFEIDGSQHRQRRAVDERRDRALRDAGVETLRWSTSDEGTPLTAFSDPSSEPDDPTAEGAAEALRSVIDAVRLCFGIVEAVHLGVLTPAGGWVIRGTVRDAQMTSQLLDTFAAMDAIWSTGVMPSVIDFEGRTPLRWLNPFGGVEGEHRAGCRIVVDWGPTWKALPADGDVDVVVRGVPLPVHAGWDRDVSHERRSVDSDATTDIESQLEVLASFVLGVQRLRAGQARAIRRVLQGGDACILLPTGHGKTLIYQLAMFLRPGLTMVVAPITALIDDQERRFINLGIDRVAAIHAGRRTDDGVKKRLARAIADGTSLVTVLSPERLQIRDFRASLAEATKRGVVALAVVDEAHCVSEWGHDFRTSYLRLGRNLRRLCVDSTGAPPPLLAMTGTASPGVLRDVLLELDIDGSEPEALQRPDKFDRANLHYEVIRGGQGDGYSKLRDAVMERVPEALGLTPQKLAAADGADTSSGIVFVPWTRGAYGVEPVRAEMRSWWTDAELTPPVIGIYSGKSPGGESTREEQEGWAQERVETARQFQSNEMPILVATKAFGMGIDKPNIRWTAHLGFPSSIEAFAQEAGRAGRDPSLTAHCIVVSEQQDEVQIAHVLDPLLPSLARRQLANGLPRDEDVGRQLFFLYNSFPGIETEMPAPGGINAAITMKWVHGEVEQAVSTWRRLQRAKAAADRTITVPRLPDGTNIFADDYKQTFRSLVDKALYRLAAVGVIDDLTIDYGADTVEIRFARYDVKSIDDSTLAFANRNEAGKGAMHARYIASAPDDLNQRVEYHLRFLVELVYRTIEPARLNALREMWRLTLGESSDERIRRTIAAYLGDGPIAGVLSTVLPATEIDVSDALGRIDAAQPMDDYDWAGAAARQLESNAGHPILLAVRAAGEAHLPQGDLDVFLGLVRELTIRVEEYSLDGSGRWQLFLWLSRQLLSYDEGRRAAWLGGLWALWFADGHLEAEIEQYSRALLADTESDPHELDCARAYRVQRIAEQFWSTTSEESGSRA